MNEVNSPPYSVFVWWLFFERLPPRLYIFVFGFLYSNEVQGKKEGGEKYFVKLFLGVCEIVGKSSSSWAEAEKKGLDNDYPSRTYSTKDWN